MGISPQRAKKINREEFLSELPKEKWLSFECGPLNLKLLISTLQTTVY